MSLFLAAPAIAEGRSPQEFACKDGTTFAVTLADGGADVRFSQTEVYRLRPKPFSLGRRYVSPVATLIIDGPFAAFVASRRIDLESCTLVGSERESVAMRDAER